MSQIASVYAGVLQVQVEIRISNLKSELTYQGDWSQNELKYWHIVVEAFTFRNIFLSFLF